MGGKPCPSAHTAGTGNGCLSHCKSKPRTGAPWPLLSSYLADQVKLGVGDQASSSSPTACPFDAVGWNQSQCSVFIYLEFGVQKARPTPEPSGLQNVPLLDEDVKWSQSCPVSSGSMGVFRRQEEAVSFQVWANLAAAPAQRTAGSGACVPHSCQLLPHSSEDTPQRLRRVQHRPGGSGG